MKKLLLFVLMSFLALNSFAQADTTRYWKIKGENSLNFSQISFKNWSAGGENSLSLNLLLDYSANYKKNNISWDNNLIIGYGLTKQGDAKVKKSDDRIDFSSMIGRKISKHWNVSGFLGFKSQFFKGYKYSEVNGVSIRKDISDFMAPAYIVTGVGAEYKPFDFFSILILPATLKMTVVNVDEYAVLFGLDEGDNVKYEFGGSMKASFNKEIITNVTLKSKLELFSNYTSNAKNIDVLWDVAIHMKINNFLTTNFVVNMIYDDDVETVREDGTISGARLQYMQLFGLGLTYNF